MSSTEPRDQLADEDVRAIATAWMLLGWTAEGVAIAESQSCADLCERTGTGWDCTDEEGDSRHPEADALAEACEMANLAIETLTARGWRPPSRVIETPEAIAAEPTGTVIRSRNGDIGSVDHGGNGEWTDDSTVIHMLDFAVGGGRLYAGELDSDLASTFPWTVLYEPEDAR